MHDTERSALRSAVELFASCQATFVSNQVVTVTSGSVTIVREVAVFKLRGGTTLARLAYAWSDTIVVAGERNVHHRVVLHAGPVASAHDAVGGFYLVGNTTAGP